MKYILLFFMGTCFFPLYAPGQTISNNSIKGKISLNSENENNSPDPQFDVSSIASINIPTLRSTNSKRLAEMENGLQVIKDIVDQIIKEVYSFSLLSQHKYMIDNCIGVKASVGDFSVQFGKPVIKVNELGKVVLTFLVDEIKFDALKIRMRPCPKDLQCHFSERFSIGGLARDLSMTITMDPMALGAASTGICAFSFKGPLTVHWRLKNLNLKPLQNNLDNVAKQMIEDALNFNTINVFTERFERIAKSILPQYYQTCKDLYTPPDEVMDVITEKISSDNEKPRKENDKETSSTKWVITPSGSKGATGNVTVNFPTGTTWNMLFKTTEDKHIINVNNSKSHTMVPGEYNIDFSAVPVLGVPVQKGMNTRIKAGTLNVVSTGGWMLYDETQKINFVSYSNPMKLGLPVGKYAISASGQFLQVEIKDGEVTDF